ncbi:MAG: BrxE family protein [Pirellulales bacterium]
MSDNAADWNDAAITRIVSLRLAVGLLGERDQAGWWPSSFMSQASNAFLAPVFGERVLHARYQGILEAARRTHDDRIGVGRVFHPFRLPEAIEHRTFEAMRAGDLKSVGAISSPDAAWAALEKLEGEPVDARSGPALVGPADVLERLRWVAEAASLYSAAFRNGLQCFPYFKGAL